MIPDYSKYSLFELKEAIRSINKEQYPENYEKLVNELNYRAENPQVYVAPSMEEEEGITLQTPSGDYEEFRLASRGHRLVAAIIDSLLLIAISFGIMWIFGVRNFNSSEFAFLSVNMILGFLLSQAVYLALNAKLLITKGQTIGKKALDIKIISGDGGIPAFLNIYGLRYLVVNFLYQIPFFGIGFSILDSLLILNKNKKCIHDYIANTLVVTVK